MANIRLGAAVFLLWIIGLPALSAVWLLPLGLGNAESAGSQDRIIIVAAFLQALLGGVVYFVRIVFWRKVLEISCVQAVILGAVAAFATIIYTSLRTGTQAFGSSIIGFSIVRTIILSLWSRRLINNYRTERQMAQV